jgi:hypothetical protein
MTERNLTNEEIFSYIAGYIEGDGCIGIRKLKCSKYQGGVYYNLIVTATDEDKKPLEFLRRIAGGSVHGGKKSYRNSFIWCLTGKKAIEFCRAIKPYSSIKKKQIETGLEFGEAKEKHNITDMERLCERMRFLNKGKQSDKINSNLNEKEIWSYFAGLIDAEGYIHILKDTRGLNPSYSIRVRIGMINPEPLDYLKNTIGGTLHKNKGPIKGNYKCKDIYSYRCTNSKAIKLLHLIFPYLIKKRKEAEIALQLASYIQPYSPALNKFSEVLSPQVVTKREELYNQLKEIKKGG